MTKAIFDNDALALYVMARETDRLCHGLPVPEHPDVAFDIAVASHQLASISALVTKLSELVLSRATIGEPLSDGHRRTVSALTSAVASAARAVQEFAEAYEQLGFLYRVAHYPSSPDVHDARQHAGVVIADRLDATREALLETSRTLHRTSELLGTATTARPTAARSRTTLASVSSASQAAEPSQPAAVAPTTSSSPSRPTR